MKKFIFLFCFALFVLGCEEEVVDNSSQMSLDANLLGVWCKVDWNVCRSFGENGKHARFAVGTNSLPRNVPVEVDAIFELK